MSRSGWTTISIPTPLFHAIKKIISTAEAGALAGVHTSASAYLVHWCRIGLLIDSAMAEVEDRGTVVERLLAALDDLARSRGS